MKLGLAPELGGTGLENTTYDLTGFTSRMVRMLAWWREAWLAGDANNQAGLALALATMLIHMHSMKRNIGMVVHVLKFGHERYEEMADSVARAMAIIIVDSHEEAAEQVVESLMSTMRATMREDDAST